MNLNELKIRIADVLGVSDTEKELAFDIFLQQAFFVLDFEETLKVPNVGFFQFKIKPFQIGDSLISEDDAGINNSLVYAPTKQDLSDVAQNYLTIDIPHQKKDLFELDESVFSIGVGKPILPISNEKNGGDAETSYMLLKKSIEERVSEVISESEHLKNFDIWEDHLSMIDGDWEKPSFGNSSTIHKLTDDIEYTEEEIKPAIKEEEEISQDQPGEEDVTEEPIDTPEEEELPTSDIDDELVDLDEYDDSIDSDIEESFNDDEVFEESTDIENLSDEKDEVVSGKTKFWGIEEFKSSDESKIQENLEDETQGSEEDANVDWDWGDDLMGDEEETEIDVGDFENDQKHESDFEGVEEGESPDEETSTNLFIQLEKSLSGDEDVSVDNDMEEIDPEENDDLILDDEADNEAERVIAETIPGGEKGDETYKAKYIKNFMILFGAFAVVVMLVLIFLSPADNEPIRGTQEDQSTNIVASDPVIDQSDETVVPEGSQAEDNNTVQPEDPLENPIEERTRQMQSAKNETTVSTSQREVPQTTSTVNQSELYRNIPNERSVRGLIFTDGSKYFVQVSSWPTKIKAENEARRLRGLGFDAFIVAAYIQKFGSTWYRVKIGDFNSTTEAETFLRNNKF